MLVIDIHLFDHVCSLHYLFFAALEEGLSFLRRLLAVISLRITWELRRRGCYLGTEPAC